MSLIDLIMTVDLIAKKYNSDFQVALFESSHRADGEHYDLFRFASELAWDPRKVKFCIQTHDFLFICVSRDKLRV